MRIVDHHELHAMAVRLGLNEFEFASVLGKVSNNLLTKSQVILETWRNNHADIAEGTDSANNTSVVTIRGSSCHFVFRLITLSLLT